MLATGSLSIGGAPLARPAGARNAPRPAALVCRAQGTPGSSDGPISLNKGLGLALALAMSLSPMDAKAIGPESAELEVKTYDTVSCTGAQIKGVRCINVVADVNNKSKKDAFNSEVFGRVRYKSNGESAIFSDYAEASDGGKIGDIDVVKAGKSQVEFILRLEQGNEDSELNFVGLKARMYPGMRQDFRIMKPVTETLDCEEAELLGEPCEELPF